MKILIKFRHGLGDAAQLTSVLLHLQRLRPDWTLSVAALLGKHTACNGLCDKSLILGRDALEERAYDHVFDLDWHECYSSYAGVPSTKVERCLNEVFAIAPDPDLCRYSIGVGGEAKAKACSYLSQLAAPSGEGRFPVVAIHYQGNTSKEKKDLSHAMAQAVCEEAIACGFVPLILDWDRRSPLPDNRRIFCPDAAHPLWTGSGTGDAERLAAIISQAALFVGIDSGPQKVAGATRTPSIAVWLGHHPIHYFGFADNVIHLVPADHARLIRGNASDGLKVFEERYEGRAYNDLPRVLLDEVHLRLTGEPRNQKGFPMTKLTSMAFDERYYEEHRIAGLDYTGFGDWQVQYGRWITEALELKGKKVLDVGCACGSILRGLGQAGAVVCGVDLSEHMISLGRRTWPDMTPLLHVCDAVNLHLFADDTFDALHSNQVAEHWRPHLVPFILDELARVTRRGGLLWCCLDTEELYRRHGRRLEDEDPTHVCVKSLDWWHNQLGLAGWKVCTEEVRAQLEGHPESFFKRYDWDWFAAIRDKASK